MQTTLSETHEILDKLKAKQNLTKDECSHIIDYIEDLNTGEKRAAENTGEHWQANHEAKAAILAYFRIMQMELYPDFPGAFDKIPLKFQNWDANTFQAAKIRSVPGAIVRNGAFIDQNCVLMPCFINIGAHIGSGTMIDTNATVGSCAQIGKNCHISGGAGIGGVLEPENACPTIIEDNCFIGARSEIAEGVIVKEGSVIAMGVFISASTKIYHRETGKISYGSIPPYSVVVPGSLPSGNANLNCAVIVKQVDASTRKKTSINELLR